MELIHVVQFEEGLSSLEKYHARHTTSIEGSMSVRMFRMVFPLCSSHEAFEDTALAGSQIYDAFDVSLHTLAIGAPRSASSVNATVE